MISKRKKIKKTKPINMEPPIQKKSTKLDILGLVLASFVLIVSFFAVPPIGAVQWALKSTELGGVGAAASAIFGIFYEFRRQKQSEKTKMILEEEAIAEDKPVHKLLPEKVEKSLVSIKEVAELLKMNFECFFHSRAQVTVDFSDSSLDFIVLQRENYCINFEARFLRPESLTKIFQILPGARKNLIRVRDEYHVSSATEFPMTEEGLRNLQFAVIMWVITPCYLIDRKILA